VTAHRDQPEWHGLEWLSWFDLAWYRENNDRRPVSWSVQIALLHAGQYASHIDLYGADCRGTTDATGYNGENRTDDRWQREEADLSSTIALLNEHGVTVNRITP
jgi:hypothetical protein